MAIVAILSLSCELFARPSERAPGDEALSVYINTDIAANTNFIQSSPHRFATSHLFDIEGIVLSPPTHTAITNFASENCDVENFKCVHTFIDASAQNHSNLNTCASVCPSTDKVRSYDSEIRANAFNSGSGPGSLVSIAIATANTDKNQHGADNSEAQTTSHQSPADIVGDLDMYEVIEISLTSSSVLTNGYPQVGVEAVFTSPDGTQFKVPGFWDGGKSFKVRFSADKAGTWTYKITSTPVDPGLSRSGALTVGSTKAHHGYIRAEGRYFYHDDGTPYFMFGNTYYGIIQNALGGGDWKKPLDESRKYGINKIRLSFFPWWGSDIWPDRSPFLVNHDTLDLAYWKKMDEVLTYMGDIGLNADLILFTDEAKAFGSESQNKRFIEYVVGRYAAYPHVIWCLTNEWDYTGVSSSQWRTYGSLLASKDPWFNPRGKKRALGIHQKTRDSIDFKTDNWLGHTIIQYGVRNKKYTDADQWANRSIDVADNYGRPAVNDEYGYIREPDKTNGGKALTQTKHRNAIWALFTSGAAGASAGSHYNSAGNDYQWNNSQWKSAPEYDDIKVLIDTFTTKGMSYWKMKPVSIYGDRVYGIGDIGSEYILYDANGGKDTINLPVGSYTLTFIDVTNGAWSSPQLLPSGNRIIEFSGEKAALIRNLNYQQDY